MTCPKLLNVLCLLMTAMIIAGGLAAEEPATAAFTVSSVREFVAALGSDRTIVLEPGDYVLDDAYGTEAPGLVWNNDRYNREPLLKVRDIRNLTITANPEGAPVRLLSQARGPYAFGFEHAANITLAGLTIGHTELTGGSHGLVWLQDVVRARIMQCELINSGMEALLLKRVDGFEFTESTIRNSLNSIIEANDSRGIRFARSTFTGFETGSILRHHHLINLFNTADVVFENCDITENRVFMSYPNAALFNVSANSAAVLVKNSRITGNTAYYLALGEGSVSVDEATILEPQQFQTGLYQYHNAAPVVIPPDRVATSMNELIAMLDHDATIYLAPGDYIVDDAAFQANPFAAWTDTAEGYAQLRIHDVRNLKIIGQPDADRPVRILSKSTYAFVLTFEHVRGLELANLTAGHLVDTDVGCESGVIDFRHSEHIRMTDTDLFGSGEIGLALDDVRGFYSLNGVIRECTAGLMGVLNSEEIVFENALFLDTYGVYQDLESYAADGVQFRNSAIRTGVAAQPKEFTVSTVERLIDVIGSNRTIWLEPGDYVLDAVRFRETASVMRWNDDEQFEIYGVSNLTLIGKEGRQPVRLISSAATGNVLTLREVQNVELRNLRMERTRAAVPEYGSILAVSDAENVVIRQSALVCALADFEHLPHVPADADAVGETGLALNTVHNLLITDSSIEYCANAMELAFVSDIAFRNTRFLAIDGRGFAEYAGVHDVEFIDSTIVPVHRALMEREIPPDRLTSEIAAIMAEVEAIKQSKLSPHHLAFEVGECGVREKTGRAVCWWGDLGFVYAVRFDKDAAGRIRRVAHHEHDLIEGAPLELTEYYDANGTLIYFEHDYFGDYGRDFGRVYVKDGQIVGNFSYTIDYETDTIVAQPPKSWCVFTLRGRYDDLYEAIANFRNGLQHLLDTPDDDMRARLPEAEQRLRDLNAADAALQDIFGSSEQ